jgi:hypothetical protein
MLSTWIVNVIARLGTLNSKTLVDTYLVESDIQAAIHPSVRHFGLWGRGDIPCDKLPDDSHLELPLVVREFRQERRAALCALNVAPSFLSAAFFVKESG